MTDIYKDKDLQFMPDRKPFSEINLNVEFSKWKSLKIATVFLYLLFIHKLVTLRPFCEKYFII